MQARFIKVTRAIPLRSVHTTQIFARTPASLASSIFPSSTRWPELTRTSTSLSYVPPLIQSSNNATSSSIKSEDTLEDNIPATVVSSEETRTTRQKGQILHGTDVEPLSFTSGSFKKQRYESDVTGPAGDQTRLIDRPEHVNDFGLWLQLLDFRLRIDGSQGAWDIFSGIRQRKIRIPTQGNQADQLWKAFIDAAISLKTLDEVYDYAMKTYEETNRKYEPLYDLIMPHICMNKAADATFWNERLKALGLPTRDSLQRLAEVTTLHGSSRSAFRRIYDQCNERNLYGAVMNTLYQRGSYDAAVFMHKFFISRGDLPTNMDAFEPLRIHLTSTKREELASKWAEDLEGSGLRYTQTAADPSKPVVWRLNENLDIPLSQTYGISSNSFGDEFCARAFATKSISLQSVIKLLASFGAEIIGPLAIRELSVRCNSIEEVASYLQLIKNSGMKFKSCAYIKVIRQLVAKGDTEMLFAVIQSDQHPDVFDDRVTQLQLLDYYIHAGDWSQARRTTIILSIDDAAIDGASENLLLRRFLSLGHSSKASNLLEDMLSNHIRVTSETIKYSYIKLLWEPKVKNIINRTRNLLSKEITVFLVDIWLRIFRAGGEVPLRLWQPLLTELGNNYQLSVLEDLSILLTAHYSSRSHMGMLVSDSAPSGTAASTNARPHNQSLQEDHMLRSTLFSSAMQRAIIEWGFKAQYLAQPRSTETAMLPASPDSDSSQIPPAAHSLTRNPSLPPHAPWARGLALLVHLRNNYGLHLETDAIRRALRLRLRVLFSEHHNYARRSYRNVQEDTRFRAFIDVINGLWAYEKPPQVKATRLFALKSKRQLQEETIRVYLGRRTQEHEIKMDDWVDLEEARGLLFEDEQDVIKEWARRGAVAEMTGLKRNRKVNRDRKERRRP